MRCPFCGNDHYPQGDKTGKDLEGVVTISFDSGRKYCVPINLDHFIIAHDYKPLNSLVGDLMNSRHIMDGAIHAEGGDLVNVVVGEDYPMGGVPVTAPYRLREYIKTVLRSQKG